MSDTQAQSGSATVTTSTTSTTSSWFSTIATSVHSVAAKALDLLKEADAEWEAIKANPVYGAVVSLAVKAVTNELTALGVPVGPLVNVSAAVTSMLDALAAAHPSISTPSTTPAAS